MIVEFVGGSLNGHEKTIERFFEYLNFKGEVYYARAVHYEKLGWVYVWYQYSGQYQSEIV